MWHLHDYESNGANLFDTYLRSAGTANQELEAAANPPVVDGAAVGLNSYLEGHNPQRWNIVLGS